MKMKNLFHWYMFACLFLCIASCSIHADNYRFISNPDELLPYYDNSNVALVVSTGRSGSTLLADSLEAQAIPYTVLKSHILPPNKRFKGKILFIFSNPDRAAESALHLSLMSPVWGHMHFCHMGCADLAWLTRIGGTDKQTVEDNLLCHDALGCFSHLFHWLHLTTSVSIDKAQILAIKYENLWDPETIQSIQDFLKVDTFTLPARKERGYREQELDQREILFKSVYNNGTPENPSYPAYDHARAVWYLAPAVQYLQLP